METRSAQATAGDALTLHGEAPRFAGGLRELADGVHAWLEPNGAWGEANAALVVGDGESLLVDTLWSPALAARMLAAMRTLTDGAPIARIVNTHADGDHCWGNAEALGAALPGAEIVATHAAAEEMTAVKPATMRLLQRLASGLALAGRARMPLPLRDDLGAMGRYLRYAFGPFDWSSVELRPPTRTFRDRLELDVGGRRVELVEVGPAHTPGDLIVHVPDASVVLAGDIVFVENTPVMWTGPAERWLRAIDRMLELEPAVILSGHGPPTDAAGALLVRGYFELVDAAAKPLFAAGRSPADAAVEIVRSDAFRASPYAAWDGAERLTITLTALRRARDGKSEPPSPPERIATFRAAGHVAERLRSQR